MRSYILPVMKQKNNDGQAMLASTLTPPNSTSHTIPEGIGSMTFGRLVEKITLLTSLTRSWVCCTVYLDFIPKIIMALVLFDFLFAVYLARLNSFLMFKTIICCSKFHSIFLIFIKN